MVYLAVVSFYFTGINSFKLHKTHWTIGAIVTPILQVGVGLSFEAHTVGMVGQWHPSTRSTGDSIGEHVHLLAMRHKLL